MSKELYASLPNEVLNLIWTYIDPLLKYSLNKENFNKYYNSRFLNIHYNHYNHYNANPNIINNFNNYNYYYYLLKYDLLIFSTIVLNLYVQKLVSGELVIKKHNAIYYKNLSFYSLIDFFYYYSNITNKCNIPNNKKCKDLIIEIISKYNLTHLIKKIHKNNVNKNNRWNI